MAKTKAKATLSDLEACLLMYKWEAGRLKDSEAQRIEDEKTKTTVALHLLRWARQAYRRGVRWRQVDDYNLTYGHYLCQRVQWQSSRRPRVPVPGVFLALWTADGWRAPGGSPAHMPPGTGLNIWSK